MPLVFSVWDGVLQGSTALVENDPAEFKVTYRSDTGKPFSLVFREKKREAGFLKKH